MTDTAKPATFEEYLATLPRADFREALIRLRRLIKEECPDVSETISYGVPTFKLCGMLVSIAAFKNHLSFFPGHTVQEFADQLTDFKVSKGTVQFQPERPIPDELVRAMVRRRAEENKEAAAAKRR